MVDLVSREFLPREEFENRVVRVAGSQRPEVMVALWEHYRELRRWNRRLALVGPGAVSELAERHYAESLCGVPWVGAGRLIDLGSGAGFPGLILAAARSDLSATLFERRERKAEFLRAAARKMGLQVSVVKGDFRGFLASGLLPEGTQRVDYVSVRALRLERDTWRDLAGALRPGARVLWWTTGGPPPPLGFSGPKLVALPGAHERKIVVYERTQEPA